VVPPVEVLENAYERAWRLAQLQEAIDAAAAGMEDDAPPPMPGDLPDQVAAAIEGKGKSWDRALWEIVRGQEEE
jgi:hypothetical protein